MKNSYLLILLSASLLFSITQIEAQTAYGSTINLPTGIGIDDSGNLFVGGGTTVDHIYKVLTDESTSTYAGTTPGDNDGPVGSAQLQATNGIYVASDGTVYFTQEAARKIKTIDPSGSTVSTLVNLGAAGHGNIRGIDMDASGNIYVPDLSNRKILKIDPGLSISVIAGSGASGSTNHTNPLLASFKVPTDLIVDANGNIFLTDLTGHNIRRIDGATGEVTTYAGTGSPGSSNNPNPLLASFNGPNAIAIDGAGNLFVGDYNSGNIRKIDGATQEVTTIGNVNQPRGLVIDGSGNLFVTSRIDNQVYNFGQVAAGAGTAVPTMGEWAMIIYGLIILSLGMVTLMRWQKQMRRQVAY